MKQFCVCILTLLVFTSGVFAKADFDSAAINTLDEVRIYGSHIAREIVPVQTLSGKELQKLSVHSVADAVRYFAGVQIKDYGGVGGLKTVNIRSMGSQHVGVFYDGVKLENAQNGIVDLGRFSLDNMDAISLYNGQKSSVFQSAKDFASASAIYLSTRIPRFEGNRNSNIKAKFKAGAFDLLNPAILWEHRINEALSYSFNAEYMNTSGRYRFKSKKKNGYDTTEVRSNGDVYALRIEQGLFGKIAGGDWKTKLYFYVSERGYPGAAVREEPGKFTHQDRQDDANIFIQTTLRKSIGSRYETQIVGKYGFDYLHYSSDPRIDVTTMYINNHYRQHEIYLSVANKIKLIDFWTANLSVDGQWNTLDADLVNFVYPQRYTGLAALASSLDFRRFKMQASVLGTFVRELTQIPAATAGDKKKLTPTIILSYLPWDNNKLNFRAFYKNIFRMPTFNDLYYTFIGNKNLKPEYTRQYNFGMTYDNRIKRRALKHVGFQIDVYYNEVTDKIVAMPTSNQFVWTMTNLGLVEIRGIDAFITTSWKIKNAVDLKTRFTYTFQKAQNFTNPNDFYYGHKIPYIPLHSGSVIIDGEYKTWDFNYSFIYTGERYNAAANIPINYTKPWYTSDFSVGKTFKLARKELKITLDVNNIFNQQYEVVLKYPMPGTNVFIKLNLNI
ncbi:MAG: TonB-dependent receptor [Prevotellaceae bacterium]|jgi:outer membrane cobalamin receptor|nr:TonB-dependent receptor [Prevotellaceae bacterium]